MAVVLNDKGINLFQFLFTLKRVLINETNADSTEKSMSAFYFNTCSKKNIIYFMKKLVGIICKEKVFSQISSNCSFDQESVFSF